MFWSAAPVVPWDQLIEPKRAATFSYKIQRPGKGDVVTLISRSSCPVDSDVKLDYSRSSEGWAFPAGWNAKEGVYPLLYNSDQPLRMEKGTTYSAAWKMSSAAEREVFFVLMASKPFDVSTVLEQVAQQLKASEGKGAEPSVEGVSVGNVELNSLLICMS